MDRPSAHLPHAYIRHHVPISFGLFLSSLKKKARVLYQLFVSQPRATMSESSMPEAIQKLTRRFDDLVEDVESLKCDRE